MGTRAAIYLRVSTVRQAEKDLSIPDQRRCVEDYCKRLGWVVVADYVESGRSARDDKRPEFQRMIDDALHPDNPFDVILVHSFSRFFRDEVYQELYIRKLAERNVLVQSSTEEVGDGFAGEAARRILGIVAELENRQRAARVTQTMQENARQGFWNGGHAHYGYRVTVAETRGDTVKKRLEIDPVEAETVRLMFSLSLHGAGNGPMGIKAIVDHLNAKGLRYRRNRLFRTNEVHRILTSSTVMGLHYYNRKTARTGKLKDPSEWIAMTVPLIVEPDIYDAVQAHLKSRRPTVTPARLTNGAMLLTQIAKCLHCGGGMSLRTGKGGRYRYYACSQAATKGKQGCQGRSIRMDLLDETVLAALEDRLLKPARLEKMLQALAKRIVERQGKTQDREKPLLREQRQTEKAIGNLLDAVENGLIDDEDLFRQRLAERKQRRDELIRLVAHNRKRHDLPRDLLSRRNLDTFGRAMKTRLRDPKAGLRKAYVRLLVDRVVVGEKTIEIRGSKAALLAVASNFETVATGQVPSSVPDWRCRQS